MSRYECRVARIGSSITTHWMLSRMAWVATKLYNTAMWHAREAWDKTGKIPTGFELHKQVLESDYREHLHTHTDQKCADVVGRSFRSWFKLRKRCDHVWIPRVSDSGLKTGACGGGSNANTD